MYKICDDDNCNYILGSMHLGDDRINKFSDVVLNAYNQMDAYASEVAYYDLMNTNIYELDKTE